MLHAVFEGLEQFYWPFCYYFNVDAGAAPKNLAIPEMPVPQFRPNNLIRGARETRDRVARQSCRGSRVAVVAPKCK